MSVNDRGHNTEGTSVNLPPVPESEIVRLRREIAERDEALARCVEALGTIELEARMFRVDPPMSDEELMAKFEAISELAGNTLEFIPASAQATAKVLAAARWVAYVTTSKVDDPQGQADAMHDALTELAEAIREEQETK